MPKKTKTIVTEKFICDFCGSVHEDSTCGRAEIRRDHIITHIPSLTFTEALYGMDGSGGGRTTKFQDIWLCQGCSSKLLQQMQAVRTNMEKNSDT